MVKGDIVVWVDDFEKPGKNGHRERTIPAIFLFGKYLPTIKIGVYLAFFNYGPPDFYQLGNDRFT
ncbi:hypothetical protein ASU31_25735 [Pedobacter ginsenosidimutans]|uniref:Uncharacterized protein n=1 Tax=Pedobacter ginsenosidimutans TaxID=687842 RepID=A0A0T5VH69_9SPHI|nr:hypothetical protein ASU31_25735 [Pedobacter ginsenosidimutans]